MMRLHRDTFPLYPLLPRGPLDPTSPVARALRPTRPRQPALGSNFKVTPLQHKMNIPFKERFLSCFDELLVLFETWYVEPPCLIKGVYLLTYLVG